MLSTTPDPNERFEFGSNWQQYVERNFSQTRVDTSRQQMLAFLGREDLKGTTFLDIGCGSGLHSLAAIQAGALSVTSFDFDPSSVGTTRYLWARAGRPDHWRILQGSVLDAEFISTLPQADLVYSWGVLHHTGDVWTALRNAASRVGPEGAFFIALYSADVQIEPPPEFWLDVKKRYVASGRWKRLYLDYWYVWRFMLHKNPFRLPEFIQRKRKHRLDRGMDLMTDIRDWLGGWPMEFVYDAEAIDFCKALGFSLEKVSKGKANTEFLFRKSTAG